MDGARGNKAKPGTKNTGSHLANIFEPGVNAVKIPSPRPGLIASNITMVVKRIQHPPNWEGKLIPYVKNAFRNR